MSVSEFKAIGLILTNCRQETSSVTFIRRFKSFFGTIPEICSRIWNLLEGHHHPSSKPKHLLFSLHFLKCYDTEENNAKFFCVDEKTFRKWSWFYFPLIAFELDVVREFI